ncbi:MAG: killer suppression protein [Deltaproteobacteria bacterium]|nr:MAG: killer suppression protein [Deltaproteobacteria bacterium]
MRIFFRTRKLQKTCSENSESRKQLGAKCGRKLQQRMMELKAAQTLTDISRLPPARCHALTGDRAGQFSVDLEHPYRLLFIVADNPYPEQKCGGVDWDGVTEIEIIEIADTH